MRAWCNGRIVDPASPVLSVVDHGVTVGDGVFETVKVVDGQPFAMTRHLRRLARSAQGMGLPDPDQDVVRAAAAEVLAGDTMPLGKLRITFTEGPGPLGSGREHADSTLIVIADSLLAPPRSTSAVVVPWTRNESGAVTGLKTTSYAENVVALAYAAERGATEALFANTRGHMCEGTGSNVFCVIGGTVVTPPLSSGCLAGITRQLVMEWYDVHERDITMEEFHQAEEVFVTSTTRDVQAVKHLDDRQWAKRGPVTKAVQKTWRKCEALDLDP